MHDDMQPDNMNQRPIGSHGESDREGAMAKADLYKLANYSLKLFKKLDDDAQLEGWVQAKITKAADYIASVFHYLEYEMEFSDYGARLDNNEMYNESQKLELKNKLMEAKAKVAELKKLQASKKAKEEKVKEGFDEKSKVGDTYKTSAGNTITKTATGLKHERPASSFSDEDGDDKSGKGKKSHAKAMSAAEKKDRAPKLKQSKTGTWGMKDGEKFDNRKTNESAKPDFLDMDKDGDKKEPMKKAVADKKKKPFDKKVDEASDDKCNHTPKGKSCPVHGMKECSMEESAPSAGMTKKEKSAVVKDAKAGKDIGKPGKSFDKVAKAAGGGEKGKKIAAAAMWKNKAKSLKESLQALLPEEQLSEEDKAQAQAGLQALLNYAKQNDPEGLAQAVQQGGQAVENYFKNLANTIPGDTTGSAENTPAEPKDMPGAGDVSAEEGVGMDIANAATFGLAQPIVQGAQGIAQNPGAFVQGAANQAGKEVGNVVNTVQGAVQGAQKIGSNIVQGVTDVANAAKTGYQQARGQTTQTQPTTAAAPIKQALVNNPAMMPKVGKQAAVGDSSMAAKVGNPLRESDELGRMKQFLTRLNG